MNRCIICDQPIELDRILAFNGDIDTCKEHAAKINIVGIQVFPHKTGSECNVLINPNKEQLRQAIRANRRAR